MLAQSFSQPKLFVYSNTRSTRGNLLICVSTVCAITAVVILIFMSFGSLFLVENWLNGMAGEIALSAACKLNEADRIGRMNKLIMRSRQLVYTTRQDLERAMQRYPYLRGYAGNILAETRNDAQAIESQRNRMREALIDEARNTAQAKFDSTVKKFKLDLPWLSLSNPRLSIEFGSVREMSSNVEDFEKIEGLSSYDRSAGNLNGSKHFVSRDSMPLPGADSFVPFKLSALPPPVEAEVAPARLLLPEKVLVQDAGLQVPCACKVEIEAQVTISMFINHTHRIKASSAAITNGGIPQEIE